MMEHKFEATDYIYSNAGQFRAIAKDLGYDEKIGTGEIQFQKGNDSYTYNIENLKKGNRNSLESENRVTASKERIINFFDKEKATSNFEQYNNELKDQNVSIVKWDKIKGREDGFTIIDHENKVAYTGKELYEYAYDNSRVLNGKGKEFDIPWRDMKSVGIDADKLSSEDRESILKGRKSGMMNFTIEDKPENRKSLDNEKVDYTVENGKINFEGKAAAVKYVMADNTQENKKKLQENEIAFSESGNKIKVEGINARKLALIGLTLVYPVAGIALMLIPKRKEIKNDFSFSKSDIKELKNGGIVVKERNGEKVLFQRDKDTNEVMSVKMRELKIPRKIGGVELTPLQYEALRNGKEITIVNEQLNKSVKVKLDLNEKNGFSYRPNQKIQETNTTETVREEKKITDRERLELIANKGAKGIDEIFKEKPSELNAFLEKHNLSKEYSTYKEVEKNLSSGKEEKGLNNSEKINSQLNKIDEKIKAIANNELSYGRSYGKHESNKMRI